VVRKGKSVTLTVAVGEERDDTSELFDAGGGHNKWRALEELGKLRELGDPGRRGKEGFFDEDVTRDLRESIRDLQREIERGARDLKREISRTFRES
jgi:hypothetical protein